MQHSDDREESLFREALQRAKGPEREAFLNQACAGNPGVHARLRALLEAHESPDLLLEPLGPLPHNATAVLPPVEGVGTVIGRYKLLEKIGEGGFGFVYVAEQREPVKRRVALKIIKLGMDTRNVIARFEAERQALALMEHAQSVTGGPVQGARLGRLQRRYANDFAWYEAISGASLAHALWVLARLGPGKMPSPSSEEEYNVRNSGAYHEPNARLIWHRDERRWASFCWRSAFGEWQAIVQPVRLPNLLKFNHNSIGLLEAAEAGSRSKLQWFKIGMLGSGGFWSLGAVDRLSKKGSKDAFLVRQHQALVALPEGPCLLVDCCQALDQVSLTRSGGLGLRLAADRGA